MGSAWSTWTATSTGSPKSARLRHDGWASAATVRPGRDGRAAECEALEKPWTRVPWVQIPLPPLPAYRRRCRPGAGRWRPGEDRMDIRATLERMFEEVINQGRMEVADELFAEDFVDHGPLGDMHGRETFKAMVQQWRAAVPDVHCVVSDVFSEGDMCGWLVRTTGT